MDLLSISKKAEKKLKKLQHVIFKETGTSCVSTPTKNLVICNVGLVNGLSEEIIYEHFSKYGALENIMLIPGKSCSFVTYRDLDSAQKAFKYYNGKLNIAQDDKPIYLLYTDQLPIIEPDKIWNKMPPGLVILKDYISPEEEKYLLKLFNFDSTTNQMKHRQVRHFGYEFRYDINNVDKDKPLEEKIPNECDYLWTRLQNTDFKHFRPDQLTVNHYSPGQGIPHHVDTHSAFEDPIVSLSLQSPVVMDFKRGAKHFCVTLPQRSLAIMSGESRYDWSHGITPRKFDIIHSLGSFNSLERGTRVSLTFRKVLQGECNCSYRSNCDSSREQSLELEMGDIVASDLEKEHVHKVYENIALHFSDTRHKPWPNVLDFVMSFNRGSMLVDVGCGNGKYLGLNRDIFDIGCDRSFGLIDVCSRKGFETFMSNCLALPLKDNSVDGCLSIAVIHHLATEERRLRAVQEMVRILKVGGRALIYVWAKDQHKGKQKSAYIMQDRKNRVAEQEILFNEVNEEVPISDRVTLPIHVNRTQFKHKDVLVPWKLKSDNKLQDTFLRFYHVFDEKELENLCRKINSVEIIKSYYDQGNWCIIIEKK
nr:alkylated DNA repair protein alkB homolog 8 isoform X1 [Leptinotarsa decemlineata]